MYACTHARRQAGREGGAQEGGREGCIHIYIYMYIYMFIFYYILPYTALPTYLPTYLHPCICTWYSRQFWPGTELSQTLVLKSGCSLAADQRNLRQAFAS